MTAASVLGVLMIAAGVVLLLRVVAEFRADVVAKVVNVNPTSILQRADTRRDVSGGTADTAKAVGRWYLRFIARKAASIAGIAGRATGRGDERTVVQRQSVDDQIAALNEQLRRND